ncbi:MAG: hypothetical protein ABW036_06730, partial [Flavitalea sp.]
EPVNGWQAFDQYILENKRKDLPANSAHETVLSFDLSDKGIISNIRILKSSSPAHDAEAARLLTNGPKWKVLKGSKATVNLTINF